jgi:hypothetical protein
MLWRCSGPRPSQCCREAAQQLQSLPGVAVARGEYYTVVKMWCTMGWAATVSLVISVCYY